MFSPRATLAPGRCESRKQGVLQELSQLLVLRIKAMDKILHSSQKTMNTPSRPEAELIELEVPSDLEGDSSLAIKETNSDHHAVETLSPILLY